MIIVHTGSGSHPLTQWGPGALSLGVERPGREADYPTPSSGITPLLLRCLHAVHWDDSTLSLVLSLGFFVFVLFPFMFCTSFRVSISSTSLSSISCSFTFLFNHIFSAYFFPLFFLAAFLVLCSLVFRSCTFPSLFRHSPLLQHWDMTHFRYTDTHFMTSHRFMSEGFVIHLVLLKLQEVQYDYISSVRKI